MHPIKVSGELQVLCLQAASSLQAHMCIQLLDADVGVQACNGCKLVVIEPQHFQVNEALKPSQLLDAFATQVQLCAVCGCDVHKFKQTARQRSHEVLMLIAVHTCCAGSC
jgi:hypothetical protein